MAPHSASLAAWQPSLWADSGHSARERQWRECANSGHPPMAWRTGQIDPKRAFLAGPGAEAKRTRAAVLGTSCAPGVRIYAWEKQTGYAAYTEK